MRKFAILAGFAGVSAVNPITRVAELLTGLSKKIEEDGKAEAKLFKAYECWYKQTTAEKTQSNTEADARIETLTTFIDDVTNGRIEFTTERQDREKELAEIIAQMEKAKDLREKEKTDFEAAKDEMNKAISALAEAVGILGNAAPVQGSFLARRFNQRKALELAKTELAAADYKFLEHALDMQPEKKDWEKLNKKATFKAKYKARSGEIQKTLDDMLKTFEANLGDAEKKEEEAVESYTKLTESKQTQRDEVEQALLDLTEENGARGMSLKEAEEEKELLEGQVENDKRYIKEVHEAFDIKLDEFKERKRLRTEEVASISEAIGILRSDDARDLFKKSFQSQGYFFTQLEKKTDAKVQKALATIYSSYKEAGASVQQMGKVTARLARAVEGVSDVITSIEEMLKELDTEAGDDLEWKEECETSTMNNQKDALQQSRIMDDETATIERKEALMAELKDKIAVADKEIADTRAQIEEATRVREAENAEYEKSKGDDERAVELITMAIDALKNFYTDNNLALVQSVASAEKSAAPGKAPAPPPTTWSSEYGGERDEHNGVVGILDLIKEDVKKDIATAKAEEEASLKAYNEFKAESEAKIESLDTQIDGYDASHATAETEKSDAQVAHGEAEKLLKSTMATLAAEKPDCDFIAVNFDVRKDNRQKEVDGLKKAKTILEGGSP